MKPPSVVIDTNVVVSGLLTENEQAPTRTILDGMLAGTIAYLLSVELLAEYREVLLRPRIRKLHGLDTEAIDELLIEIAANGVVIEPARAVAKAPDSGDQHLWTL